MFRSIWKTAEPTFATERFFAITQMAYAISCVAHVVMAFNFLHIGFIEMSLLNFVFSIPLFAAALAVNNVRKICLAFVLVTIEFYVHQVFGVYYMGLKGGFQYFLIFLSLIPFFNPNWKRSSQVFMSASALVVFILLNVFATDYGVVRLTEHEYFRSYLINCMLAGTLFVLMMNHYIKSAAKSEEELDNLVTERTRELHTSQRSAVYMLGEAGHFHDDATGAHIWRMAMYTRELAKRLGWSEKDAELLELAAAMHDTGKIGIPDAVLKKPGKLNAEEWEIMKSHCEVGYNILSESKTPLFQLAAEIALYHHEKWDGSGYPTGLSRTAIPESARIVAIADVFDALTMKRPYKDAWPIENALAEIERGKETHFAPELVDVFLQMEGNVRAVFDYWGSARVDVLK